MDSVLRECLKNEKNSLILRCKTGITRLELDKLKYCEVTGEESAASQRGRRSTGQRW